MTPTEPLECASIVTESERALLGDWGVMRNAIEFLDLVCHESHTSDVDELSLMLGGARLWSGRLAPGAAAGVKLIKVIPEVGGVVKLWHIDTGQRVLTGLGRHRVEVDADTRARVVAFSRGGARYELTYRVLQVAD